MNQEEYQLLVRIPNDKPLGREVSRGLRGEFTLKTSSDGIELHTFRAHPRTSLHEKIRLKGYYLDRGGERVLICTARHNAYRFLKIRYEVSRLNKAWEEPALRLWLKQAGIKSQGEGIGEPLAPELPDEHT